MGLIWGEKEKIYLCIGKFALLVFEDLFEPFILDIIIASSLGDTESYQENVRVVIGQNPDAFKLLLTGSVPETSEMV